MPILRRTRIGDRLLNNTVPDSGDMRSDGVCRFTDALEDFCREYLKGAIEFTRDFYLADGYLALCQEYTAYMLKEMLMYTECGCLIHITARIEKQELVLTFTKDSEAYDLESLSEIMLTARQAGFSAEYDHGRIILRAKIYGESAISVYAPTLCRFTSVLYMYIFA